MFSSRPPKGRPLALRLTLWYAGIFTISAGVAFVLFYLLISAVFRNATDRGLSDQHARFATLLGDQGIEPLKRVVWLEAQAAGEQKIFIRMLLKNGQVVSSSNMSYWRRIPINENLLSRAVDGQQGPVFETVTRPDPKSKVRILYGRIAPGLIVQLGRSMENVTRVIDVFQKGFITTMILLIVLAAGVGWFMARRALSGVSAVTRTARQIADGALNQRVPVRASGDEIDQMATTFNLMLDRIQALVSGIREMSDNIAHDLRSPVTRIRGLAEVTLTTGKSLDDFETMAADTIEECDRLLDMINTMLVISETEAGVENLQRENLDMADLAAAACELFHPLAEDKGVALDCRLTADGRFRGDRRMLQRMMANVIDNAIKYTDDGGTVTVGLQQDPYDGLVIAVSDTGMGISDQDLPHVFERFYRCDRSRSAAGVGLGLSLSRAIARAHGGDIGVDSRPGEGSRFTIRLPQPPPR